MLKNSNPCDVSDTALMAAVSAGETSRLEILFERHHRSLYSFLRRTTGNPTLAEDLTQDAFLRVLRYRSSYNRRHEFRPWLFRIARNILTDHFSLRPREDQLDHESPRYSDERPSPRRIVEGKDRLARVETAITALSTEQRDALLLARFHDFSYRQIGDILGCSEGAVKARVFRALKSLTSLLEDDTGRTR
jgi:RNA polymerase sigma-70 factor (ECF subfamily)